MDLTTTIAEILPSLNAASEADLGFWTAAELYEFADEAAKRLAKIVGGFVERDTSISTVAGTALYTLPARHVSTVHVSLADAALRDATAPELEAANDTWMEEPGVPERWLQDGEGTEQVRIWPTPLEVFSLPVILHRYPATLSAAAPTVQAPACLREFWAFAVIGEARGKEGKAAMPEVAAWAREMAGMVEKIAMDYWGTAQ